MGTLYRGPLPPQNILYKNYNTYYYSLYELLLEAPEMQDKAPTPGEIIKKARKSGPTPLSQYEFGQKWGKSQSTICKYENNEADPPGDLLIHCMNIITKESFVAPNIRVVTVDNLIEKTRKVLGSGDRAASRLALMTFLEEIETSTT
ncbi:helix-turn-helix domain-containing protein [Thiolapillus sp.]|uniref:helix-turn-helix domain-containing protein n=1 Tax=Thiolapillus sp. TaxID=2017437 RepID=UPI003AF558E5